MLIYNDLTDNGGKSFAGTEHALLLNHVRWLDSFTPSSATCDFSTGIYSPTLKPCEDDE